MTKFKKDNLILIIPLLILNIISIFNMVNAKLISSAYNDAFLKQIVWFIIGYLIILILQKVKLKNIFNYAKYFYFFSLFLLILVLIMGSVVNGAKCWLNIMGFSFQPSELAKISLALYLTSLTNNVKLKNFKDEIKVLLKLFIITLIPSILVFLEPDTGAIINFLIILLVIIFSIHLNKWWYITFIILSIFLGGSFFLLYYLYPDLLIKYLGTSLFYRMDRLINFTKGTSYQLENALITIGASSFMGVGFKKILLYIPEAPTDFIFSFSMGNFGFLSVIIVIICFIIINFYLFYKTDKLKSKKYKLFIYTYIAILIFHEIYNISMNLGLMPIMGIPLPFLSYGGTNILINYLYLALIIKFINMPN